MKECHSDALETAVLAGSILLQSGAEIFRVEDTILRIAKAYGVGSCNTFIMSSGIFTTSGGVKEEYFAKVQHIPLSAVRLDKVEAVNQLSREIAAGQHTVEEAHQKLMDISAMVRKPRWLRILASGVGCGSFCFLFGGTLRDCGAAFITGFILYGYLMLMETKKISKITLNIIGGAIATFCSFLAYWLGIGENLNNIIIGTIMPLVPGVPFTNSIRDIADGDYIAGSVRMIDALLVGFCIAGGVGAVYTLLTRFMGVAL